MPILTSFPFTAFLTLIVLNFVLIFSGRPLMQAFAGAFAVALILAALVTIATVRGGRIIGAIVLLLGLVMAALLAQQAGYAI